MLPSSSLSSSSSSKKVNEYVNCAEISCEKNDNSRVSCVRVLVLTR
jgi:hypothetical protein